MKARRRVLGWLLAVALAVTFALSSWTPKMEANAEGLETVKPAVVVTGTGIIGDAYSSNNVSLEKSYTLDELKAIDASSYVYSTINTSKSLSVYSGVGANLKTVLQNSGFSDFDETVVQVIAQDGWTTTFNPEVDGPRRNPTDNVTARNITSLGSTRYFFPQFNQTPTSEEGKSEVPPIIAWKKSSDNYKGNAGSQDAPKDYEIPEATDIADNGIRLMVGQLTPDDVQNPSWNGDAESFRIVTGDQLTETVLTVGSKTYTRAQILMMERADHTYSYTSSGGDKTDYVRGVPMSVLLKGYDSDSIVTFETVDGYGSKMEINKKNYTVQDLIDNDYMLAYEKGSSAETLQGIYDTAKNDTSKYGFLRLYGDDTVLGSKPANMINQITVTASSGIDFSTSPYKHITNGGQEGKIPYNIDAITGATLTVEGPGVTKSVPVSVRDLEGRDGGAVRATYTDTRDGTSATRTYEGIDLHYILNNMKSGDNGIQMTDKAKIVQIKNRNRKTIAEFTTDQVDEAHASDKPILVAYGTSNADGSNIRPFVFNGAAGEDTTLGNNDGCLKLVYDKESITDDQNDDYTRFGNMAYIYVAEQETPGYKHNKDPYQSADISNYVVTVTGDKIGREVNYTVAQLENMVEYGDGGKPDNSGMGYRDEYSLANSTYWYVNEYEGVQLWKLLLQSGLDPALATDEATKDTIVGSTATDGYAATDKFTIEEVADPDSFGFYEKNPADPNTADWSDDNNEVMRDEDHPNGDLIKKGYPVLVAYGVNGYPYVEKSSQEGYLSGLQNDGGPLRLISGKRKYNHANGSNQAKLLDKILVGDDTYHYSTHKYHKEQVYKDQADETLTVRILNGPDASSPVLKEETYKVGDIEELIYGGSLTRNQLKEAKVKTFYQLYKGSSGYSDLYEGLNLNFFLNEIVEIPGYKGTVTFDNGNDKADDDLALNLEDVLAINNGSNTKTGMNGLSPLLAYGKNGAPMVVDKNADGYVKEVTLAGGTDYENDVTVKNDGGPLAVLLPHTDNEEVSDKSLTNVKTITINLSADQYAHVNPPYDSYKDNTITFSGEGTKLTEAKSFTVSELEGKQTLAYTGDYSILKDGATQASQTRYRGISLYRLLTSTAIGLKSNADKVIVTTTDGESKEFTLSDIRKMYTNPVTGEVNMPIILAYGVGKAGTDDKEVGLPLVEGKNSEGYDSEFGNTGGPVRLVVGQTEEGDVNSGSNLKFVKSIEVTASEMTSWNHSSAEVYKQYLTETVNLQVVDKDGAELFNKDYTVGEIEENTSLVERITATTTDVNTWEGINFWQFVKQETAGIDGVDDPITVDVTAADGFSKELRSIFGLDALNNGIRDGENYISIILAYGMDEYPLVIGDKTYPNGEGYDATAQNNGGPLRLITHNNQGASLTYVKKIKITVGEGGSQPEEPADFTIHGLEGGDVGMTIDEIKNLKNASGDPIGQATGEYVRKGVTKKVKGALLKNILAAKGVEHEGTKITLNTPDKFEDTEKGASYKNITLKQAKDQAYFVAYQEWDTATEKWKDIDDTVKGMEIHTNLRMYRNYCEANGLSNQTEWYDQCDNVTAITVDVPEPAAEFKEYPSVSNVRSTTMDEDGNLWVGTYGKGLHGKSAGADDFDTVMKSTDSEALLKTDFTSAVAVDSEGGIWISQNASYTQPNNNQGVLYIKDGSATQYTAEDNPSTIPNNYVQAIKVDADGKVWFGSFGGVTVYDPEAGTWTTYTKESKGFPATSCNTIVLDGEGGAWLGFYPDGQGTEEDPYVGGFCHMDKNGEVTYSKSITGEMTQDGSTSKLAQAWVRSIAIDQKGTVWAVCAGTNLEENEGGTVWKYQPSKNKLTEYKGEDIFAGYLDGSATTEVRVVSVDAEGNLWFGTSSDGILVVSNPQVVDGKMTVDAQYAKETGAWSTSNMNNIYSIDFWNNGTAYVGSSGGLLVLGDEPVAPHDHVAADQAVRENVVDPTYNTAGSYDNVVRCTVCGEVMSSEKVEGDPAALKDQAATAQEAAAAALAEAQTAAEEAATAQEAAIAAMQEAAAAADGSVEKAELAAKAKEAADDAKDKADAAKTKSDAAVEAATEAKRTASAAKQASINEGLDATIQAEAEAVSEASTGIYNTAGEVASAVNTIKSKADSDAAAANAMYEDSQASAETTLEARDEAIVRVAEINSYMDASLYKPDSVKAYKEAYEEFQAVAKDKKATKAQITQAKHDVFTAYAGLELRTPISEAKISGLVDKDYTGKAITQNPTVTLGETVLAAGADYEVSYKNNTNGGTATVIATGTGDYTGTVTATFKINKIKQKMTVKAKTKKVKVKALKKKARKVSALTVNNAQGTKVFKKVGGSKKLRVNAKTGKITVKKKTKKGKYKIKIKVTANGNANYKAATKTVTVKIRVK